jgi:AcrR family transcriptional regulator
MAPSKPRPRLSAQVRKDAIARAALPLFARNGLHGVTTRELAVACGVSEALIFRHFPTKEALFNEMLHQYSGVMEPGEVQVAKLPPPSTRGLVQLVFLFIRLIAVREAVIGKQMMHFFYRSFTEDGKFARRFLQGTRPFRRYFEASLVKARRTGDALALATPPYNLFWFMQHVATAACMVRLAARPVVRYRGPMDMAVEQMTVFTLRGIGLSESAIREHATHSAFVAWRKLAV